jgi:DNA-3-methyladenine glycosylase
MERRLFQRFFDRPALEVAEGILGKVLVRRKGETLLYGIITEVEAYDGPEDKASHAHSGRTKRNAPMFGPAGHWYIYLVYGMHWMLNIVTGPVGYPAAVLIRGVGEWNGPGKLTRALNIDQSFNAQRATKETGLWVEDHGIVIPRKQIQRTPRIGVDYAGAWAKKPYRFVIPLTTGEG